MFKNETEKFKHNDNLKYFAYCLLEHFKMYGLDTITYCPDPTVTSPTQQMLSVLANYPHFKKDNAAAINLHQYNNLKVRPKESQQTTQRKTERAMARPTEAVRIQK